MTDDFDALFNAGEEPERIEEEKLEATPDPVEQEQEAPDQQVEEAEVQTPEAVTDVAADEEPKKDKRDHPIPLPTFLDMRDRAKAAEADKKRFEDEAADLRRQIEALNNPAQRQSVDPYVDPQGYETGLLEQVEQRLFNQRAHFSRTAALKTHGEDAINAAVAWAEEKSKSDPSFDHTVFHHPDPAEWVIQQHKAAMAFQDFNSDPDAYVRKRAAELGLIEAAPAEAIVAAASTQPQAAKVLPRSISSLQSANQVSKTKPRDEQEDFNALFDRK